MRAWGVVFLVLLRTGCGGGSDFLHEHSQ